MGSLKISFTNVNISLLVNLIINNKNLIIGVVRMKKYDDFDLKLNEKKAGGEVKPQVSSRYLCTIGSCNKWICITTTTK